MIIVSAVIPTRGRPELLLRAVCSALAQTLREIEVVVVIDGEDAVTRLAMEQGGAPGRTFAGGCAASQRGWIGRA